MFGGIVEEVGRITRIEERPGGAGGTGRRFWIEARRVLEDARVGDSIAVSGCCLTAAACDGDGCEIALIPHTLRATVAGSYAPGRRVNLEVDLVARYLARLLDRAEADGSTR